MNFILQRILKPLLIILAILALIAAGIVVFVDPNHYKHQISSLVYKKTGRNLTIDGDIKWKLTPNIAISIQNIKLNNPAGFSGDLLTAEEARIKLNLFSLMFGKVSISGIELQTPKLNLVKLKSGKSNLAAVQQPESADSSTHTATTAVAVNPSEHAAGDIIAEAVTIKTAASQETDSASSSSKSTAATSTTHVATTAPKASKNLPTIKISRININNATVNWEDQSSNQHFQASNLNVQARNLNLNSANDIGPILLSTTLTNLSNQQPGSTLPASIQIEMTAMLNAKNKQLSIDPLTITHGVNSVTAKWNTTYANNVIAISDLALESAAGIITGKLQAILPANALSANDSPPTTINDKEIKINAELHGKSLAVDKLLTTLGQAPQFYGTSDLDLTIETKGQQADQLQRHLNGKLYLAVNDGKIIGADLHQIFKQAEDTLNTMYDTLKQSKTTSISSLLTSDALNFANLKDKNPLQDSAITSFDKLSLAATFSNGISKNVNCNITHRDYNITGNGELNLPNNSIAMNINALYQGNTQAKSSEIVEYILHTPLVVMVHGAINNPQVSLDMQAYMQTALQQLQRNLLKDFAKDLIQKIIPGMQNTTVDTAPDANNEQSIINSIFKKSE